ncbi:MAG: type II toxin-antitoxin system mRNA interferase toxin, RelE/StbE family [Gammaproteobacteria bacterium]|nr:type II toxin-antitoxin system mRNA interferase toxin, RelE/StbE family [Gammaproteobacteria bacterium]
MIEVKFSESYEKKAIKFFKKHKDIAPQYIKTIEILANNPYHPSLRLHKLQGKLSKFSSVSINLKYRIVIDFIMFDNEIILIDIGSHDNACRE